MKTKKFWLFTIIAVFIAACVVTAITAWPEKTTGETKKKGETGKNPPPPPQKQADPRYADSLLKNLAGGMIALNLEKGGGGKANFASDISDLKPYVMQKALCAFPGEGQTSYGGYIVRLEEYPAGDAFKTNFRLVAYPADGYVGKEFFIDKSEQLKEVR